ncbi:hypothetical protein EWW47_15875 [Bacillus thuringiensis]|uniref:Uncharacterized protein n=1 Tax=Bacillus thuringiensis TaxID=1428 RepID=A0AB35PJW7_BACTU|nr:hypothetical protein DN406_31295 [Bacillus sp. BB56-3]KAA8488773.1 hypothetical protein FYW98_08470 [Bacillus thuringiensis]KAB2394843.1 hypothetical protein F8171_17880 [Bacillus cereus]MDE4526900.1 hypothetical protein [Bacillus thuringiensis]MDR4137331.1 hypothetical protein [Bacillus cereus]
MIRYPANTIKLKNCFHKTNAPKTVKLIFPGKNLIWGRYKILKLMDVGFYILCRTKTILNNQN